MYFIYLYMYACVHHIQPMCGGLRTTSKSWFFPSAMWIPEIVCVGVGVFPTDQPLLLAFSGASMVASGVTAEVGGLFEVRSSRPAWRPVTTVLPHWVSLVPSRYEENQHNCLTFALAFINCILAMEGREQLDKHAFTEKYVIPRTRLASKYIMLFRAIQESGFHVTDHPDPRTSPS